MTPPISDDTLDRDFYEKSPVLVVARELLGCVLVSRLGGTLTSGRIVETEAYAGLDDPASHTVRLSRSRARMGGHPGLAYVHRSYGLHDTLNVVTGAVGEHAAVLIRALEPVDGLEVIRERRAAPTIADHRLLAGPGNLARGLAIGLSNDGRDLTADPELHITRGEPPASIHASPRIGITKAADWPWRFFDADSRSVSAHRRGTLVT
ncbi:MAG TPA: DNA-3-methyladenine glycosylase [Thermomicrobiales bacterium]|jgi:DNA-3-methyladenine glycosylase|nr:DNA-3-methyladenine glycosylase [Thermomicrobiales bacterium]